MKRYLIAALAAASFAASADSEFRQGADFVRITALPCKDAKVVAVISAAGEDATDYRSASAEVNGVPFAGCWKPDFQRQLIFLRYEDGDAGMVPVQVMKPVREV